MFDAYVLVFLPFAVILFALYLIYDYFSTNPNAWWNKWIGKTVWIWLPFYALRRLIREVIFKKQR